MTWAKVDDRFHEHPKLAAAGAVSWGMWLAGIAYCNRALTDGFIPESIAEGLGGRWRVRQGGKTWQIFARCGDEVVPIDADWIAQALVDAGLWHRVEGGYQIHDFADFQPSRAEVLAARQALSDTRRAAGAKGGKAKQDNIKAQASEWQTPSKTVANGEQNGSPVPVPVPVPEPQPHPFGEQQVNPVGGAPAGGSRAPRAKKPDDPRVAEVHAHWLTALGKSGIEASVTTSAGKARVASVAARLADGYDVAQLKRAVDGCARSDFHREGGHTDLTLIMRAGKVDGFIDRAGAPPNGHRKGGPYLDPGPGMKGNTAEPRGDESDLF